MTTPTVIAALIEAANEIERLGGDPSRFHKVAHGAAQPTTFNEWWLSLPKGRRVALQDDKWRLADAAYEAGKRLSRWDAFIADFERVHGKGDA